MATHIRGMRVGSGLLMLALLSCVAYASILHAKSGYTPREGDILFQTSLSAQSHAIQLATHSRWSHMGMIYMQHGRPFVLEAVQPVKLTSLTAWIARGYKQHFVVRRLRDSSTMLTTKTINKMRHIGHGYLGRNYDLYFGWSDKRLYCSELVWKVYARGAGLHLGKLQKLQSFDLSSRIVRAKLRERYGAHPPMNETVISPASIFNARQLVTVYEQ